MTHIEFNKKSNNNPFKGLTNCLSLYRSSNSPTIPSSLLDKCWEEVKNDKQKRQMFFSLLFSIGDITNRQHNIFKKQSKDTGGIANREGFTSIVKWLYNNHKQQFITFLNKDLFIEYNCLDTLLNNRIKTIKNTRSIIPIESILKDPIYRDELAHYLYKIIRSKNTFNKQLVAKFLTLPRLSKRSKHNRMLPDTKVNMQYKIDLLSTLSDLLGWNYVVNKNYVNFKGYRKWRKTYNQQLESVLFSTKKINSLDKQTFLEWLNSLPALARFRVKNRLLYSTENKEPKYPDLKKWYEEWESFKEQKQSEQRVLEEKIRQNLATDEDKEKLKKITKEAKVNTGAVNFATLYSEILSNSVDKVKLESFIQNKVNLPYNSLVIIDDSGSMCGAPFNFATFIASVCLYKNPDDDARNLLCFFDDEARWYTNIDRKSKTVNRFINSKCTKITPISFVNPNKSFYDNYQTIKEFCNASFQGGCTNISSVFESLKKACVNDYGMLDTLKSYPIWTIISDGDINNMPTARESMLDLLNKCETYFGFKPFIVLIEVNKYPLNTYSKFDDIENLIHISNNVTQIEQFLTNIKDMDTIDNYSPLLSIFRSNRYELIRDNTL